MSKARFDEIHNRVTEIESILALCGPGDDDVRENLLHELNQLIKELKKAL